MSPFWQCGLPNLELTVPTSVKIKDTKLRKTSSSRNHQSNQIVEVADERLGVSGCLDKEPLDTP